MEKNNLAGRDYSEPGNNPIRPHTPLKKNNSIKRSNLLFIGLIAALFLAPFLVYGLYTLFPEKGDLPHSCQRCTAIRIDNPTLTASEVKVFPRPQNVSNKLSFCSYAYYQGKKKYAATLRIEGTVLHIGPPVQDGRDEEDGKDEKLTLHIRLHPLERVELNGQTIWTP